MPLVCVCVCVWLSVACGFVTRVHHVCPCVFCPPTLPPQLDKFRGQLADVEKDKKSLSGKSGQQARELRELKEALNVRAGEGEGLVFSKYVEEQSYAPKAPSRMD